MALSIKVGAVTSGSSKPTCYTYVGSTGYALTFAAKDSTGAAVNLTSYTAYISGHIGGTYTIENESVTITTAASGLMSFTPESAHIATAGKMEAQIKLISGGGLVTYSEPFVIDVGSPCESTPGTLAWTAIRFFARKIASTNLVETSIEIDPTTTVRLVRADCRLRANVSTWDDEDWIRVFATACLISDTADYTTAVTWTSYPAIQFLTDLTVDLIFMTLADGTYISEQATAIVIDEDDIPADGGWVRIDYTPSNLTGTVQAEPPTPPEYPDPNDPPGG